ncbi:MAG: vitamin B12-dependent ribonucleotide reductase [Vampirovibrionales bacterium]|nr:vitamin B12-dependent ribonucleotide reductase [Vampirovibrionales bacterium]
MSLLESSLPGSKQSKNNTAPLESNGNGNGKGSKALLSKKSDIAQNVPQNTAKVDFPKNGMRFHRRFTKPGVHPFDELTYEYRTSKITEPDGTIIFEMKNVEVPATWSQLATDILVSKYFRKAGVPNKETGELGSETSVKQVVHRLAHTMRTEGEKFGVFASSDDAETFEMELAHLLVTQKGAFNSPVWFNCGLHHEYGVKGSGGNWFYNHNTRQHEETVDSYSHPQCSACFIQSVEDDLMSLFDLAKNEARLFKFGSGTGTNFSKIRGRQEKLSGGGTSSGLMSFLEVLDRGAGATKSGGTTRRAAKMVCLDMDHPEIVDFINWKVKEEKKVKVLIDAGYPSDFNGEAYHTVAGQNSNNSVRLSDGFMGAYLKNEPWQTKFRTTGEVCETLDSKDLMDQIAFAAWACADPGVQFDDIINDWNTCLNTDRIYGSNPCSEYHFLDNTACNLASINLMKFMNDDGTFDVEGYQHACRIFFTAQEILVDFASYPTKTIAENSHAYRPLGLGYANLGTLMMVWGIPYDSPKSFALTGAITAIMHGEAYKTSSELAATLGAFPAYENNASSMLRVMNKHRAAVYDIDANLCDGPNTKDLMAAAKKIWDEAVKGGEEYGYRNAQATVLAPTGTIGLLMDCDTTGIEPDFALVKWKKLAGGGYFKIINQSVPRALKTLGYTPAQTDEILKYILGHATLEGAPFANQTTLSELGFTAEEIQQAYDGVKQFGMFNEWTPGITPEKLKEKGMSAQEIKAIQRYANGTETIEGAPHMKDEHLPVFDCANKCGSGKRFIAPMAHINIMAAAQPFLSGAISKTVNLPGEATVEDIKNIYVDAWKAGLKCVALYRDGSKFSQPLSSKAEEEEEAPAQAAAVSNIRPWGDKRHLPAKRNGITVEASVSGHKIFLRTGEYEDGTVGEIFIDMFKEGAAYRSMVNCLAVAVSMGLKYGVPLEKFVEAFTFTRFEPAGFTDHPNIRQCTSIVDFIFRVVGMEYLGRTDFVQVPPESIQRDQGHRDLPPAEKNGKGHYDEASVSDLAPSFQKRLDLDEIPVKSVVDPELALSQMRTEQLKSLMGDAPFCSSCGSVTVRNGSCYRCTNCGNSEGCS